jgi:hypothetical protein
MFLRRRCQLVPRHLQQMRRRRRPQSLWRHWQPIHQHYLGRVFRQLLLNHYHHHRRLILQLTHLLLVRN